MMISCDRSACCLLRGCIAILGAALFMAATLIGCDLETGSEELRYERKSVRLLSLDQFTTKYPSTYATEWIASPPEKRVARDLKEYTLAEFQNYFSTTWRKEWRRAMTATQLRMAQDMKDYTMAEFSNYYGPYWNKVWMNS